MENLPTLSNSETMRYNRQIILPQVGLTGQEKLQNSSVLVVGAGGLGSPVLLYLAAAGVGRLGIVEFDSVEESNLHLAAAGVGRLGIVEFDSVEESNLHRQVLFGKKDVGRKKADVVKEKLRDLNPFINVEIYPHRLDTSNALEIISRYDVIVDGTDNYPTRYLVNDACVILNKPNVYGSISQFEGRVTVFDKNTGPCYRCLHPNPPNQEHTQNCAQAGVLGVLPGMIGMVQATETIKVLLDIGEPLVGRMLLYDALDMSFDEIAVRKNMDCPVCGENPAITVLADYEAFCSPIQTEDTKENMEAFKSDQHSTTQPDTFELSPSELSAMIYDQKNIKILDVRDQINGQTKEFNHSIHIPLSEIPGRISELDKNACIVVVCRIGEKSKIAATYLRANGFNHIYNLTGGLTKWSQEVG